MKKSTFCLLLILALLLSACAQAAPQPQAESAAGQIAAPVYPEMAPYPDEMSFLDEKSGEFDSDGMDAAYTAWREDRQKQYSQPEGYADSLAPFFSSSIPSFLAASQSENAVCSPLNVYMALALLAEVTGGDCRQQILDLLHAGDLNALRTQAGHVWNAHYCADSASTCVLANSVWLEEGMLYNADTLKTLADSYYASAFQGDLGSEAMDALLRDWINEQTGGLLEEQAQNLHMDPQTVLALASTIYYRAKWSNEFWEEGNTEGIFHAPAGDIPVTYMNQTQTHGPYFWGEDFGAVSLGLEDGSRMWLILPDEGLTPEDLLHSGHALQLILGDPYATENQKSLRVNLTLPKFDVACDAAMNDSLKSLGITHAFEPLTADFTPILPEDNCWLDSVSHAARVAIDEEGVTAAAYTVMLMCGSAMPPEEEMDFILDRPFLFVITSRDNLPLFAGVVRNP